MPTIASYAARSPCGWYFPSTSPTTAADLRGRAPAVRRRFWYMAYRMRRWTGLWPAGASGRARGAGVLVHGVQEATLDRLEPVAHVRQRARRDDAQRVAEVALLGGVAKIGLEQGCCSGCHRPPPPPRRARILAAPGR